MDFSSIKKELCKFIFGNKNQKMDDDLVVEMVIDTNIECIDLLTIEETNYLRKICKLNYNKNINYDLIDKDDLKRKIRRLISMHKIENESNSYSIERLNIPQRVYKALKKQNILTIKDLLKYSIDDLYLINNLGDKSIKQIIEEVHKLGFLFYFEEENVKHDEKLIKLKELLNKSKKLKEELNKVDEEIETLILSLEKKS